VQNGNIIPNYKQNRQRCQFGFPGEMLREGRFQGDSTRICLM